MRVESAAESLRIYAKIINKSSKIHPKSTKMEPRSVPRATLEANRKQVFAQNIFFEHYWRHLADLGRHFGPHRIPKGVQKSHIFVKTQHKMQKNEVQEGISKKHDF